MTGLPGGSVTLLFTDLEGSTRLASELRERWPGVLAEQRRLLRSAFAAHSGLEVDTQGDAFFVAFARARDAAAAAADCQRALASHVWPAGTEVRVRIGLHSGEPMVTDEGYAGIDVHKAARICAAAHGGQILLSQATRALLGEVPARDLGEFRLKDLTAAERLFQLEVEGVERDFLPPRSLNATNLPTQPMRLIGRRDELAAGLALLRGNVRLLTLTGPGGTGKTRLALQLAADLAHHFRDGVYWIPLASISDSNRVGDLIATFVGAPVESDGLLRFLRERELLLLADNFEHVLAAAPLIGELLASAPDVKVLVTSRAPLHLAAEHELAIAPLPEADALELFTERARAVRPNFEPGDAAVEICRRLDCIPLALELAAARLKHLTASSLLARLNRSLDIVSGGPRDVPERQRTLRATIDWSYQLLQPEEQRLLDRLAVFAGRATLEQVERVCADDDAGDVLESVSSLVDNSLLRWFAPPGEPPHYFMLESVHEFARERLVAREEEPEIRRRHRDYFLQLAEELNPIDRMSGIRALVPDRNNLRAALQWSLEADADADETLRLAFVLWRYWLETGSVTEGRDWLDAALATTETTDIVLHARALDAAAFLVAQRGDFERALALNAQSLTIARTLDGHPFVLGWALFRLGQIQLDRGALDRVPEPLQEAAAIFRNGGWPHAQAWALIELHRAELLRGDSAAACRGFAEVVELVRRDDEPIAFAYAQVLLGSALALRGDTADGLAYVDDGLELLGRLEADFTLTVALLHAAPAFRLQGASEREREAIARALRLALDSGIAPRATACLEGAARTTTDTADHSTAARLWGAADQISREQGVTPNPLRVELRQPFEQAARAALGDQGFRREFERGRSLSLVNALELGLQAAAEPARSAGQISAAAMPAGR